MNQIKRLESVERSKWTSPDKRILMDYADKYLCSKANRLACGWEQEAENGWAIRDNKLPIKRPEATSDWQGKFYVDPWLYKGLKFLVSMQTGSDIEISVVANDDLFYKGDSLLKQEIEYDFYKQNYVRTCEASLMDRYFTGMGWVRGIFDAELMDGHYQTGTPVLKYIDARDMFVDAGSREPDLKDCRYIFQRTMLDMDEMKTDFPDKEDKIQESIDEYRLEGKGKMEVITCQYVNKVRFEKVIFTDNDTGRSTAYPVDEYDEYVDEEVSNPDTQAAYEQAVANGYVGELDDFVVDGGALPEKTSIQGTIRSRENAVFQTIFVPSMNLVLSEPKYVGKKFTYFCTTGIQHSDCAYFFGFAGQWMNMQELDIINMTVYALTLSRYYRGKELIQADSLVNQEQYEKYHWKLGINPIVKSSWQQEHQGQKAVETLPLPEPPRALLELSQRIQEGAKSFIGATESMMGNQQYAGQPAQAIMMLQQASTNYLRDDLEKWQNMLEEIADWDAEMQIMFRYYPHTIKTEDEQKKPIMAEVNTDSNNTITKDNSTINVTVMPNQKTMKDLEKQVAVQLFKDGLATRLTTIKKINNDNPEEEEKALQQQEGLYELAKQIEQNPELPQMMAEYIQTKAQNGKPVNGSAPTQ
jgi:hypothetical protein